MSKAIYVALSGAVAQENALEATASNIANASTAGYQRLRPVFRQVLTTAANSADQLHYSSLDRTAVDTSQGAIRETGRALDVVLPAGGYLALVTPRGERYTRAGSIAMATDGTLTTQSGTPVSNDAGAPIKVDPPAGPVTIDPDGSVKQAGAAVGKLKVVSFDQPDSLTPEGAGTYSAAAAGNATPTKGELQIGAVEESNAQPVTEMTDLMTTSRTFESFQKVLDTLGDLERRLLTTVPDPGE